LGGTESVVTSSGLNDTGLFETNLHDERFLPFEGAGAIATWELSLPDDWRAFDYNTISDVILHLRYTAREGGEDLRTAALENLTTAVNEIARMSEQHGLAHVFSLRQDFPVEWLRLTAPAHANADTKVELTITKNEFPFLFSAASVELTIGAIDAFAVPAPDVLDLEFPKFVKVVPPGGHDALEWSPDALSIGPLPGSSADANAVVTAKEKASVWRIEVPHDDVAALAAEVTDVFLVCHYTVRKRK
jgi:hypothetical protein